MSLVRFPAAVISAVAVFLVALTAYAALDFPALTGRVVDQAGLLTPQERDGLDQSLAAHEQATGQQVVVVTLNSLQGTTIEDYGVQLARHWGIGEKDKNTGAVFIIAPNEKKVRIEVGYGLEGVLTDAESHLIIDRIVLPAFRSGQFGPGIVAGTGAILKTLAEGAAAEGTDAGSRPAKQSPPSVDAWLPLIFMIVAFAFLLYTAIRRRRQQPVNTIGGRDPTTGRGGRRGPPFIFLPPGDFGGGGFGGGSDGGFGGFSGGGGSFGGGGASGSW